MAYQNLTSNEAWNRYFLNELKKNGFSDKKNIWETESGTFKFVHFSPNLPKILETGSINLSGGGLIGAIYVTPIRSDGRVHNLGKYIYENEFPQSLNDKRVECLVFEVSNKQYLQSLNEGKFNYIFKSSYYTQSETPPKYEDLYKHSLLEITKLLESGDDDFLLKADIFFQKFIFLKHVYFESLNEFLYTRQNSSISLRSLEEGEVYAENIKDYLFEVTPKLKTNFSTTHILTDSKKHIDNLKNKKNIIKNFDSNDFLNFLIHRIRFYLTELQNQPEALLGRLMLKMETGTCRQYIEQIGADRLREESNHISLYQYETIPKGEFGITSSDNVLIYKADYSNGAIKQNQQINLKINPSLTTNSQSILRVKS